VFTQSEHALVAPSVSAISRKSALALLGLVLLAAAPQALAQGGQRWDAPGAGGPGLANATVLIIRHAEKPASGTGLSPAGEARARAYASYFRHFTLDGVPVRIDALIAAADSVGSRRPKLTLEPLSHELGLPIQLPFKDHAFEGLAKWLAQGQPGRTILIAWHHTRIPGLLGKLGLDPSTILPAGRWPPDVYDWVIVLRFDRNGEVVASSCRLVHEPSPLG